MQALAPVLHPLIPSFHEAPSQVWVNKLLTNRIAYHILFWVFVFGFSVAYISFIGEDRQVSLYNLALRIPFIILGCYLNLYVLMPRFYYAGRIAQYAVLVLLAIFSINAVNLFVLESLVESPICPTTFEADATFNYSNYLYKSFYLFSLVGLTSGIKLSKNHYVQQQQAAAIEKEKLQTELSFLKSQIQPHFFFNTLNNLYSLTIKKSDRAPEVLLKLSDLMSYGLYDAEAAFVSLEKEVEHMRNYVELESLRLGGRFRIEFSLAGELEGKRIQPLIFLPFIENCFKHVAPSTTNQSIIIQIKVEDHAIHLHTCNPFGRASQIRLDKKGGLGLKNAHRRLQLLFGANYQLEARQSGDLYLVDLNVPLL